LLWFFSNFCLHKLKLLNCLNKGLNFLSFLRIFKWITTALSISFTIKDFSHYLGREFRLHRLFLVSPGYTVNNSSCLLDFWSWYLIDIQHQTISGSIPADNITNDFWVELDCSKTGAGGNPCSIMLLHDIVLYSFKLRRISKWTNYNFLTNLDKDHLSFCHLQLVSYFNLLFWNCICDV